MLKTTWHSESFDIMQEKTLFIFTHMNENSLTISFRANTESEAWEKLGALLGNDDKENVETEVFDGVVITDVISDFLIADIKSDSNELLSDSLVKYEDKRVEVTIRIKP